VIDCSDCRPNGTLCGACRVQALRWLAGTASCRGGVWAERVVRRLRGRGLQPWPACEGKAARIAARQVEDLGRDMRLRCQLAVICHAAARERYEELRADPEALLRVLSSRG
jgi:hypothetical protein